MHGLRPGSSVPKTNSSRNTSSRLIERTHHRGPGPLASTPTAPSRASQLLQAGPPARPATVLTALRFSRLAGSLSPSTRSWTAVSGVPFRGRDRRCGRPPDRSQRALLRAKYLFGGPRGGDERYG
jgi:hypothetical protein